MPGDNIILNGHGVYSQEAVNSVLVTANTFSANGPGPA